MAVFNTLDTSESRSGQGPLERLTARFGKGRRRDVVDALSLLSAAGPSPSVMWSSDGAFHASPEAAKLLEVDRISGLGDLEAAFAEADRADFARQFTALRARGEPFDMTAHLSSGDTVAIAGRRAGLGEINFDILWLRAGPPALTQSVTAAAQALVALLDGMTVPAWLRGPELDIVWCNRACAESLGKTREEIVAGGSEIAANVLDRSGRGIAEKAREQGKPLSESRHVVIGGARRLLEIAEHPSDGGNCPAFGFALDRTPVEEIQNELERHLSAHAEVLEQLRSAIAIFGPDMRLKFFNGAMCELWGLSEQWMAGHPTLSEMLELLRERRQLPEQADFRRYKLDQMAMFTSLIEPHQELLYRPDGSIVRLLVVPHPMGGLMFSYEDVTSRLQLESSYNTLIAVQRETLDNLAEGIAVFGGDGRLGLWNPPFAKMWGLDAEALEARPHVSDLAAKFEPFFAGTEQAHLVRDIVVGNALDRTPRLGRIGRSDGVILEYRSVPLPDGAVLNSFTDVTDSDRVEQALRDRNDALLAADQLKLDFLANVSYQLRTPLNAMIGFTEILTNRYFGELNDRQAEYVDGVLQAGRRLEALIDAILDLSSIEAGYLRLDIDTIDIPKMIEDVRAITAEWAQRERIELTIDCQKDVGRIIGDERRVKQVLLNLLANAIKFTPPGGWIELAAESRGDHVLLIVSDNGVGIPEEDRERVFAPFERARRSHPRSGAGVGLALVKRFVTMHGGTVELLSDPDTGTKVICLLPRRPPDQAVAEPA